VRAQLLEVGAPLQSVCLVKGCMRIRVRSQVLGECSVQFCAMQLRYF
jgi:hypothetical protein